MKQTLLFNSKNEAEIAGSSIGCMQRGDNEIRILFNEDGKVYQLDKYFGISDNAINRLNTTEDYLYAITRGAVDPDLVAPIFKDEGNGYGL